MRMFPSHVAEAMMRRKPLEGGRERSDLHRTLTAVDLMLYGVGCSVGAGIYCLVGIGAQLAGPAISLSFFICGAACIFTSLAYAEFAARIPITGSAYVYAYVAFGEYWGWLVGWFLTLGYAFTASVVARSWADYVASFLSASLDISTTWLTKFPLLGEYNCSPLSIVIVALCTWVLVSGAKESSRFNNIMTMLNISVLLFVVLSGLFSQTIQLNNWEPYAPHGIEGIARGAGLVFFAFIGFDMVACLSEEVIHPERNMPIGIVGSLVISATIYVSVSLVVIGMAPYDLLGQEVPITNALLANACCTHEQQLEADAAVVCLQSACTPLLHSVLYYGGHVVSFGAIFGLTTGTFTSLMGQPRIFYGMAQDGLLFPIFGIVDPTTGVPTAGILITGVVASLLACFIPVESLANMISLGTLMVFTFVDAGVIILRWSPGLGVVGETLSKAHGIELPHPHHHHDGGLLAHQWIEYGSGEGWMAKTYEWLVWFRGKDVSDNGIKPVVCVLLFTVCSLIASETSGIVFILCGSVAVASALLLSALPQSPAPATFSCPLVPLVPLIGIAANATMMGSIPASSWVFVCVWLFLGNAMYFLYGIRHSRLGKQQHQPPLRMLSLPESMPLTNNGEGLGSYESTTTGDLEHRAHHVTRSI